ncbi:MAG: hypothetical protein ACK56I_17510, partial [bacterium]
MRARAGHAALLAGAGAAGQIDAPWLNAGVECFVYVAVAGHVCILARMAAAHDCLGINEPRRLRKTYEVAALH